MCMRAVTSDASGSTSVELDTISFHPQTLPSLIDILKLPLGKNKNVESGERQLRI